MKFEEIKVDLFGSHSGLNIKQDFLKSTIGIDYF